jgi:hypothetical protein
MTTEGLALFLYGRIWKNPLDNYMLVSNPRAGRQGSWIILVKNRGPCITIHSQDILGMGAGRRVGTRDPLRVRQWKATMSEHMQCGIMLVMNEFKGQCGRKDGLLTRRKSLRSVPAPMKLRLLYCWSWLLYCLCGRYPWCESRVRRCP